MSVTDQRRVEAFLRKSLLGEELVNTQFHLFSSRSVSSRRLTKPRVLCANNVLLAKSSRYFSDLLSSDIHPSEGSLSDLTDANDVPGHISIDDYGYGSDSDLDDDKEKAESQAASLAPTRPPRIRITTQPREDDELSEDGSESVSSDMFVMSPEHPKSDEGFGTINMMGEAVLVTSGETAVEEGLDGKVSATQTAMRLRSLGSRHILVKDTAFQTWYALLNYLYTDGIKFVPLRSTGHAGRFEIGESLANSPEEPRCSAKSMYRLACKVGLDDLRDEALAYIKNNLTEHNILNELSCNIVSSHPQLLEMELDVLYTHIGSPPVVTGFAALARRIADKALRHGADIIVGIHTRLLKERQPSPQTPMSPLLVPASSAPLTPPSPSVEIELPAAGTTVDAVESRCATSTPILQYQSGLSWGQRGLDLTLNVGAAFPESIPGNGECLYGIPDNGGKEDLCGIPDDGGKEVPCGVLDDGTEDMCSSPLPKKKKGGSAVKGKKKKK